MQPRCEEQLIPDPLRYTSCAWDLGSGFKPASLTAGLGYYKITTERKNNYVNKK